ARGSGPARSRSRAFVTPWRRIAPVRRSSHRCSRPPDRMVSFDSDDLMMFASKRLRLLLAVAAVGLAMLAATVVDRRLSLRLALGEGEAAFRRGDFVRAADGFRSALEIDPASTPVRLRLIAASQQQHVPGGEASANRDGAKQD